MSTTNPSHAPACEHCDDSVPHTHLDVRAVVDGERARARRIAVLELALAAVLLAGATVLAVVRDEPGALWAAVVVAVGWVVATAVGVGVTGVLRARSSDVGALLGGSLTAAAGVPVVAVAVALVVPGGALVAVTAAAAWLGCTAVAELVRARAWRRLLLEPGPAGERARGRAVAGDAPGTARTVLRWTAPGVLVGACVWLVGLVPAVVVVLVPLSVALAVVRARATGAVSG
ncbi:hypothetical protein PU560_05010 [Georgenia sp. 10Sc9-8]|uniref:Uncharacterized protein n=1 Tax=Georgenia halotolerans TaxID=3028317 RepID=A0ABT5TV40_9MICO|nr:hypothetical protein [Georgenia halotolerans]